MDMLELLWGDFGGFILVFLTAIFAVFLIREIVTWYWKINKIVDLLERIERNTKKETSEAEKSEKPSQKMNLKDVFKKTF